MVDVTGAVEIKDFSLGSQTKKFRVNDDVFEATPEMPLTLLVEASKLTDALQSLRGSGQQGLESILSFFDTLLLPDSAALFRRRVVEDKLHPIGLRHIMAILPWLLEEYGLRPHTPSEESAAGSDGTGTTSTAGAPSGESILSSSPLPESSTSSSDT